MAEPDSVLEIKTMSGPCTLRDAISSTTESIEEQIPITTTDDAPIRDHRMLLDSLMSATPTDGTIDYHRVMRTVRSELIARVSAIDHHRRLRDTDDDSFDDTDDDEAITLKSDCSLTVASGLNYAMKPCPICLESAVLQSTLCCTFQCCGICWRAHISATINDGRIQVPCISSDCSKYLTKESIVNFIRYDAPLHERYLKLYIYANQNPRAKTCPRCSHLYSLDEIDRNLSKKSNKKPSFKKEANKKIPKQVQCSECSLVWCFRCAAPWHENMTCKQFVKGDKLLLKWIKQKSEDQWNARKCPKCSSFIQRAGGCPHMTCSSCQCEFCYLCGRQYMKIPVIGSHGNKFSVFGCPYNLHPEKPWLRRTIRGSIATGVVVASPIVLVGAITAAVTVLPTFGIYKDIVEPDLHIDHDVHLHDGDMSAYTEQIAITLANYREYRSLLREMNESVLPTETNSDPFPLSIFAEMDVENLFLEREELLSSDNVTVSTTSTYNDRELTRSNSVISMIKCNSGTDPEF
ncbi:unnamed protein product [Adineta ricciae]|uniref:RBR-type E3 ubiquitin transferase n=1 Tax=Adineta ricciae TaxID=249248 RepID=A0A814F7N7_ADIRI|nr:unnamed protein product [Adineta ricciae]